MANEISYTASITHSKNGVDRAIEIADALNISISTNPVIDVTVSVGTAEEAIPLGEVSCASGILICINLDATNFVQVRTATSGTAMIKMLAGEGWPVRLGSGISAPFAIADTAACLCRFVLFGA